MPTLMTDLERWEERTARTIDVRQGIVLYGRTYAIPDASVASLPDRGATVTLDGITATGLMVPRVYSRPVIRGQGKSGNTTVQCTFYQIRTYGGTTPGGSDTGVELEGSRQESEDFQTRQATRLFIVSSDSYASLPDPDTAGLYPGDTTEKERRFCVGRQRDDQTYPGLILYTVTYQGLKGVTA